MVGIETLIEAAQSVIDKFGDGQNHTVAAAILNGDGRIVTGLNLAHFTGGPDAEISALANLSASENIDPMLIVAVGERGRGILSPCGKCRQILFDYYPDINVVVAEKSKPIIKSIVELLPNIFDYNAQ